MRTVFLFTLLTAVWAFSDPNPAFLTKPVSTEITDEGPPTPLGLKIVAYPFNRALDLIDTLTFQFGFGFGFHGNVHMTRALQAGAGGSAVSKLGFDGRDIGLCNDVKAEASVLAVSGEYYKRQNAFGTYENYDASKLPWLYRSHRDYFGLGAEFSVLIANLGFELHPKEGPDFLLGFLGIDYMHDDFPKARRGNTKPALHPVDAQKINKVVICCSRVVSDPLTRMATDKTAGAYYHRYPREKVLGRLGEAAGAPKDQEASQQLSQMLAANGVNIYRLLMEELERTVVVHCGWDVVNIDHTLDYFNRCAVLKKQRGVAVKRLPDYRKLAAYYGADAILDVRVWECGVWRQCMADKGVLKMDVQAKLIAFPENKVVFDARVVSQKAEKAGQPLLSFAAHDGQTLVREVREGCGVISARLKDHLVEEK